MSQTDQPKLSRRERSLIQTAQRSRRKQIDKRRRTAVVFDSLVAYGLITESGVLTDQGNAYKFEDTDDAN